MLQGELGSPGKKRKKKVCFQLTVSFSNCFIISSGFVGQEGGTGPSAGVREVQAEELAAKIQENEKLHMKV